VVGGGEHRWDARGALGDQPQRLLANVVRVEGEHPFATIAVAGDDRRLVVETGNPVRHAERVVDRQGVAGIAGGHVQDLEGLYTVIAARIGARASSW
jgi:hypothetical protein